MKYYLNIIAISLVLVFSGSCGTNTKLEDNGEFAPLEFGRANTFEVLTWNLREFPLNGEQTLQELARLIPQLKVDVLAFQEINDIESFYELARLLPGYDACVSHNSGLYRLAYLYNTTYVSVNDDYLIYTNYSNPFPRPPHVLDLNWHNQNIILVNNHLKAAGDNYIDHDDPWDQETRRLLACQMLEQYVSTHWDDRAVIVLGDMNDNLADPEESNVFMAFISQPHKYLFADMYIAENPSYSNVSYPSWSPPSHLDHIMITDELFTSYSMPNSKCETLLVENAMGNWQNYRQMISDHRPVALRLQFGP